MNRLKSILPVLALLIAFLGYSYYNYSKRAKAVNAVQAYMDKNNMKSIWHFREAHLNLFDWVIEDKSQFNFIYVNEDLLKKRSCTDYWIQFSSWKNPQDIETLTNYTVKRQGDNFNVIMSDLFWIPNDKDSLTSEEINGTVFQIVDNWISENR